MATKRQKMLIHMLVQKLGLSDTDYRAMLQNGYQVESSSELSYRLAEDLREQLEQNAIQAGVWQKRTYKRDPELASFKQIGLIRGLWDRVSYIDDAKQRDQALKNFLQNKFRVDLYDILKKDVPKVITTLDAMRENQS